jgi:hypothetical protein
MAFNVGQKLIAPSIIGGAGAGGYALYDKANGNYTADPYSSAQTGAMVGLGIGALATTGTMVKGISKKVSNYTAAKNTGASPATLNIFNNF